MNLANFEQMDPMMLLSIINMKLRDDYADLDDLVKALDLDKSALVARLAQAGFDYLPDINQFR